MSKNSQKVNIHRAIFVKVITMRIKYCKLCSKIGIRCPFLKFVQSKREFKKKIIKNLKIKFQNRSEEPPPFFFFNMIALNFHTKDNSSVMIGTQLFRRYTGR